MFLGFALVWLFVCLSQRGEYVHLSPVAAGWILGLPLVDVVSVMVGRLRKGNSPFSAGRDHLHHLMLDNGFSVRLTTLSLLTVHSLFVACGLLVNQMRQLTPLAFWIFVLIVVVHHICTPFLLRCLSNSRVRA